MTQKVIEVENTTVVIESDYNGDFNPRQDDNLGVILYAHRTYVLGDETFDVDSYDSWEEVRKGELEKDAVVLPVYAYEHSDFSISTTPFSCPFDSGQVGFVYVTKEKIRREYGVKRVTKKLIEKVENILKAEIEDYNCYLQGDVYVVSVDNEDGLESCGGFLGYDMKENGVYDFISGLVADELLLKQIEEQL